MAIKIYEGYEERDVFLKLVHDGNYIKLIAVDINGSWRKNILRITSDGRLFRYTNADIPGLQTDVNGRIKLNED